MWIYSEGSIAACVPWPSGSWVRSCVWAENDTSQPGALGAVLGLHPSCCAPGGPGGVPGSWHSQPAHHLEPPGMLGVLGLWCRAHLLSPSSDPAARKVVPKSRGDQGIGSGQVHGTGLCMSLWTLPSCALGMDGDFAVSFFCSIIYGKCTFHMLEISWVQIWEK